MAARSPLAPALAQSLSDRRQLHARQRARVLASLILIPGRAKPTHRRWADPGPGPARTR